MNIKNKYDKISFYGLIFIIIAASFRHFSAVYYYFLNPDHAIHILMTANFRFPHDLYFWGQDRLGSFIPLLGSLILKITGMNAVRSVSIANYLMLITGYFCISTLFRKKITKFILAVFWFFPPLNFLDFLMIAQPFGIQMSLLAIVIFIFNKISSSQSALKNALLLSLISVIFIISIWVSELTIISVFLITLLAIYSNFLSDGKRPVHGNSIKTILKEPAIYVVIFWITAGLFFIIYAKNVADKDIRYTKQIFNNLNTILLTFREIIKQIKEILTFGYENNVFLGIFGWLSFTAIFTMFYLVIKKKREIVNDKWFRFFLIQSFLALLAISVSHWVFRNGISRRYFVFTYMSLVIAMLLIYDKLTGRHKVYTGILIATTAVFGLLSSTVHIYYPVRQKPKYEEMKEFRRLGKAGIISEYWNSYIPAIAAPGKITSTPNDKSYYRNRAMADSVFRQPGIYIIKDSWLDSFPDKIMQFGYTLEKANKPFELGGATMCEYKLAKTHKYYTYKELKTASKKIRTDKNSTTGRVVEADSSIKFKYLVYGPFITLNKGKYKVVFNLRSAVNTGDGTIALLDVTSKYGKLKLSGLKIKNSDFPDTSAYHPFELDFKIDSQVKNIEFRVYYTGKEKLWLDNVELIQTD